MQQKSTLPNFHLYSLLVVLILIWGFSWPISKLGLAYIPPLWFAALRLILGTVTMFCVVIPLKKCVIPRKEDLKLILVLGGLQIAAFLTCITIGLHYVAPGRSAILVYTTPLWIVPISVFFFDERVSWKKYLGCLLGLVGIIILLQPWAINWHDVSQWIGNGFLLLASLCWAISILCARHMHWSRTPLELISWQLLFATCLVTAIAFYFSPAPVINWDPILVESLIYSGTLSTSFAYWGTMVISKELPPVTTSLSLLAIPVCGVLASILLTQEQLTASLLFSMFFILSGLVCVTFDKPKKKNQILPD